VNLADPPPWHAEALCPETSADAFFPDRDGDNGAAAIRICGRCPVRTQCLEHALQHREEHGVWGGTTPNQREQLAAARRRTTHHHNTTAA
jgi:WhiB family redox-sensing transcriptional regulator